jgi:hypothetical protein
MKDLGSFDGGLTHVSCALRLDHNDNTLIVWLMPGIGIFP